LAPRTEYSLLPPKNRCENIFSRYQCGPKLSNPHAQPFQRAKGSPKNGISGHWKVSTMVQASVKGVALSGEGVRGTTLASFLAVTFGFLTLALVGFFTCLVTVAFGFDSFSV
jgi:hypothetical protein